MGTAIAWTEKTWNPTVGCHHKSPGCDRCYAERLHGRLTKMGSPKYAEPFDVVKPWEPHLEAPLRVKKPTVWFVNSMSDLFHAALPFDYLRRVFDVMERAHWHRFQVLTKRSERLPSLAPRLPWPPNVWMGVSIESQDYAYRADQLRMVPAAVRGGSA
jgi:protein gp37